MSITMNIFDNQIFNKVTNNKISSESTGKGQNNIWFNSDEDSQTSKETVDSGAYKRMKADSMSNTFEESTAPIYEEASKTEENITLTKSNSEISTNKPTESENKRSKKMNEKFSYATTNVCRACKVIYDKLKKKRVGLCHNCYKIYD